MSDQSTDSGTQTVSKKRSKLKAPRQYKVLLLNDDYTTMDFVVAVLEDIFNKSPAEAVQIMQRVHRSGRGVAGIYTKEIAEAKVNKVHAWANEAGFPLKSVVEEV